MSSQKAISFNGVELNQWLPSRWRDAGGGLATSLVKKPPMRKLQASRCGGRTLLPYMTLLRKGHEWVLFRVNVFWIIDRQFNAAFRTEIKMMMHSETYRQGCTTLVKTSWESYKRVINKLGIHLLKKVSNDVLANHFFCSPFPQAMSSLPKMTWMPDTWHQHCIEGRGRRSAPWEKLPVSMTLS